MLAVSGVYVNLDPAAEEFEYEPDVDIKDLICLEDVMDEMGLGPNGGLMACFEYVLPLLLAGSLPMCSFLPLFPIASFHMC